MLSRLTALHKEMVEVRSAAQVSLGYGNKATKSFGMPRVLVELTSCNATIGVTQAARTILDVRNVSFYSQQRARDDSDTLEVCTQKLIQCPPARQTYV